MMSNRAIARVANGLAWAYMAGLALIGLAIVALPVVLASIVL
jgi:hypothetical protein